nr:hypothetical transcript [Hymenolepis microstoma]
MASGADNCVARHQGFNTVQFKRYGTNPISVSRDDGYALCHAVSCYHVALMLVRVYEEALVSTDVNTAFTLTALSLSLDVADISLALAYTVVGRPRECSTSALLCDDVWSGRNPYVPNMSCLWWGVHYMTKPLANAETRGEPAKEETKSSRQLRREKMEKVLKKRSQKYGGKKGSIK